MEYLRMPIPEGFWSDMKEQDLIPAEAPTA
jgi:hypothetical protein